MMDAFSLADFADALDPLAALLVLIIGGTLGASLALDGHLFTRAHAYRVAVAGVLFFVPLALMRGLNGSMAWERILGSGIQWQVFALGIWLGARLAWRWRCRR